MLILPRRKFIISCAAGICAPAIVRAQTLMDLGAGSSKAIVGGGTDPATTAWVNAVTGAGGAVSNTQKTNVNNLIVGLKADSLFSILDACWLFAGESDHHQAQIDIINLRTQSEQAVVTLAAGGYTGDGVNGGGQLNTTFAPSTAGGNFVQNSAHLSAYARTTPSSGNRCLIGAFDGTSICQLQTAVPTMTGFCNDAGVGIPTTYSAGFWLCTRTASNLMTLYEGTTGGGMVSKGTDATGSAANETQAFAMLSRPSGQNTDAQIACCTLGGGLNATQAGNLFTRINAYMTAWGVNI